uniref:Uncharacterized protein n=1 Tax=Arundo donax TaxID=35708 RepID=A0A0A8YQM8_ARUDO
MFSISYVYFEQIVKTLTKKFELPIFITVGAVIPCHDENGS